MAPKILIYYFVYPSFKFAYKIILVLCLHPNHYSLCSFTNIMARRETAGSIRLPSDSGYGDGDGPEFICCVHRRQPEINEVWNLGEDDVPPKVHPYAHVDVRAFFGELFDTDKITPTWRMIPIFGRTSINGIFGWLGVPNFLRNDRLTCTLNLLAPYVNLWDRGSSTSPKLGSGSGE